MEGMRSRFLKGLTGLLTAGLLCASTFSMDAFADNPIMIGGGGFMINENNFPDDVFREYILENFDPSGDGMLNNAEIEAVKSMDISRLGVETVEGIVQFTYLESFTCDYNDLTYLELPDEHMKYLSCSHNQLIYFTAGYQLESIYCDNNQLTELDVSRMTELKELDFSRNRVNRIDLTHNSKLKSLKCSNNSLSELNLGYNTELERLEVSGNPIRLLELRNNPDLSALMISSDMIKVENDGDLGWVTKGDNTYYVMDKNTTPKSSRLAVGERTIDGKDYTFSDEGVLIRDSSGSGTTVVTDRLLDITVLPSSVDMTLLDTKQLAVVTDPSDFPREKLSWTSLDENIVRVDSQGRITPVGEGNTYVTVSSTQAGDDAYYMVPVNVRPVLSFTSERLELLSGQEEQIEVTRNTGEISSIRYASNDDEIAIVDDDGVVTAVGEGRTSIEIAVTGYNGQTVIYQIYVEVTSTDYLDLTVNDLRVFFDDSEISDQITAEEGDILDLTVLIAMQDQRTFRADYSTPEVQTGNGKVRMVWRTSDPNVASVNQGRITIRSAGLAIITVRPVGLDLPITFTINAARKTIDLQRISIISPKDEYTVGDVEYLTAVYAPQNADDRNTVWESTDPKVATVDANGRLTVLASGYTIITATAGKNGSVVNSVRINVRNIPVSFLYLGKGGMTVSGGKNTYRHDASFADHAVFELKHGVDAGFYVRTIVNGDAGIKDLAASSSSSAVEVTDVTSSFSGLSETNRIYRILPKGVGTATITIRTKDGSNISQSFTVRVLPYNEWLKNSSGELVHYNKNSTIDTGWKNLSGKWYHLRSNGAADTGWKKLGKWYYFDSKGVMQTGWKKLSGKYYFFGKDGAMKTGWQKSGKKWYYLNSGGAMQTGWKKLGGKWYRFDGSGAMVTGWKRISGKWYYFNPSGAMQTGWKKLGGDWFYFETSGAMKTGWMKSGSDWYYFHEDENEGTVGSMATGETWVVTKVEGFTTWRTLYRFNSSGVCLNRR